MSQTDLAIAIGMTFQQLYRIENGVNRLSASQLRLAARALGVPLGFFFSETTEISPGVEGIESDQKVDSEIRQFLASKDAMQLNKAYMSIKDENLRRSIVALVKAAAGEKRDASLDDARGA